MSNPAKPVTSQSGQPMPKANHHPAVWDLVMADIKARDQFGKSKYGVRLQPHNGRDPIRDAYEEALDLVVYLRQAIYEQENSDERAREQEHSRCIQLLLDLKRDLGLKGPCQLDDAIAVLRIG